MSLAARTGNDVTWPESDLMLADLCDFLGDTDVVVAEAPLLPPMQLIAANDNLRAGIMRLEPWPRPVWIPSFRTVE